MVIDRVLVDALVNGVRDDAEDAVPETDADHQPLVQECGPKLGLVGLGRHTNVRQHRAGWIGLAFELEAQRFAHDAMGAIRSN